MKLRWPLAWRARRATPDAVTSAEPVLAFAPAEPVLAFDVSIDFDQGSTDPQSRQAAADAVRAEIAGLPGAEWVSVETHPGIALEVRLFEAGCGIEAAGAAWDALRRRIEAAATRLLTASPDPGAWAAPAPARLGFAEAAAANPLDALEQLAALAALRSPVAAPRRKPEAQAAKPVVAAPIADAEVGRLARLLALVLPVDASEPAAAAVRRFGSFAAVLAAPEAELRRVPGLGTHSIAAIKLVHAAAVRLARAGIAGRPVLDDRKRLADYLSTALARERIEQFRILFLDEQGMLRADEIQAQGTVNHTPVYPREVVRRALALGAASLILVHNHPSGDPAPSREDIEMTKQVRQAASVMKIALRDHVIIGNGRWLSFRDQGLLD